MIIFWAFCIKPTNKANRFIHGNGEVRVLVSLFKGPTIDLLEANPLCLISLFLLLLGRKRKSHDVVRWERETWHTEGK
jgi:hypothetical protein